jgi:hypothetical protein
MESKSKIWMTTMRLKKRKVIIVERGEVVENRKGVK